MQEDIQRQHAPDSVEEAPGLNVEERQTLSSNMDMLEKFIQETSDLARQRRRGWENKGFDSDGRETFEPDEETELQLKGKQRGRFTSILHVDFKRPIIASLEETRDRDGQETHEKNTHLNTQNEQKKFDDKIIRHDKSKHNDHAINRSDQGSNASDKESLAGDTTPKDMHKPCVIDVLALV